MRLFRRNRLSEEQLQQVLQSLPQMKAPADLEVRLDRIVEVQRHEVPHILGSLPLVPAPEDFDARLMRAINDRRRPNAPVTYAPVADAAMRVNWMNNIMGWAGGALMVVTLAFVIDRSGLIEQNVENLPGTPAPVVSAPATPSGEAAPEAPGIRITPGQERGTASLSSSEPVAPASSSATTPAPAQASTSARPMMERGVSAQPSSPVIQHAASPVRSVPAASSAATGTSTEQQRIYIQDQPVQSQPHPATAPAAIEEHQLPVHRSAAEMTGEDSVTPESDAPSETVDTGMVDTGGERTESEKSKP